MTKYRFLTAGALAALALALPALPAHAQDDDAGSLRRGGNAERVERQFEDSRPARAEVRAEARAERMGGGERPAISARQAPAPEQSRRDWGGRRGDAVARAQRADSAQVEAAAAAQARNSAYTAPRDRSYGANSRVRDWAAQRQAREAAAAQQQQQPGAISSRSRWGDRNDDARRADWQRDRRQDARRDERRDDARTYANGYLNGRRDDNRWDNNRRDGRWDNRNDNRWDNSRYGQNHRRWDNRGWRNDNRYDWYRYRASNRSLFSLGRYYAPYRGYSYSRINIGFRLGSPFYSNRYWINDPWQYRLPEVYGPYRWVRYYDDALLVDIYSGEVVDVIHSFFW